MGQVVTIGLDIAKSVFQVHGVDAAGEVGVRRQIRRGQLLQFFDKQPPCLVGIEACGVRALLGSRAKPIRPPGPADAGELRQAVREAAKERRCRRGGDLRGGHPTDYALRRCEKS